MEQTFELINVVTFSELTGLSKIDLFVLLKKYNRNVLKSANDWHSELENDFVIPNDIRTPAIEISKSRKILEKLSEKNKD